MDDLQNRVFANFFVLVIKVFIDKIAHLLVVTLGIHQNVKEIATLAASPLVLTQSRVACQMCETTYCCLFLLLACQISLIVISCDRFGQ
jgi:hypothetical protein